MSYPGDGRPRPDDQPTRAYSQEPATSRYQPPTPPEHYSEADYADDYGRQSDHADQSYDGYRARSEDVSGQPADGAPWKEQTSDAAPWKVAVGVLGTLVLALLIGLVVSLSSGGDEPSSSVSPDGRTTTVTQDPTTVTETETTTRTEKGADRPEKTVTQENTVTETATTTATTTVTTTQENPER